MSLDIGDALSEGFDRTFARNGLVLMAVFAVFGLVNAVVHQSLNRAQFELFDFEEIVGRFRDAFGEAPFTAEELRQLVEQATPLAYLDGLSFGALFVLSLLLAFVAEAIRIVAVRTLVSDETETIPRDLARRNLAWATFNGVIGGIVVGVLVVLGLFLLVLPGLFLLVAFFFVRQEIAVEDENFVDAMANSWSLTKGSRIELLGLALLLFVATFGVSLVSGVFGVFGPAAESIANVVVTAVVLVFSVAVVAQAYNQLRAEDETEESDDIEEYMDEDLDPV